MCIVPKVYYWLLSITGLLLVIRVFVVLWKNKRIYWKNKLIDDPYVNFFFGSFMIIVLLFLITCVRFL